MNKMIFARQKRLRNAALNYSKLRHNIYNITVHGDGLIHKSVPNIIEFFFGKVNNL